MNILFLYNASQTYTATVFEHLASFRKYSENTYFFAHQDWTAGLAVDFAHFDGVVIHYSIRLPFDHIAEETAAALARFRGLKALFIQDEYDYPHRAWSWIRRLGIDIVFTVVPREGVSRVYPPHELPGVRFVSVLTGYVPDDLPADIGMAPSRRPLVVGYRGRPLPIRYGDLGRDKVSIGKLVARYCRDHDIQHDIHWSEESRIYGPRWYAFISSCRAMLGSESGSNVFDWDGTLEAQTTAFVERNPRASDDDIYAELIQPLEQPGLMNQISPKAFEAIAARTVLVLFEGTYSGVVSPGQHYIPLKKDGSNLAEVFRLLEDGPYVDAMADRAYRDVIASGRYSYQSFVALVDAEMGQILSKPHPIAIRSGATSNDEHRQPSALTTSPIRAAPPQPSTDTIMNTVRGALNLRDVARRFAIYLWWKLPEATRVVLRPHLKRMLG